MVNKSVLNKLKDFKSYLMKIKCKTILYDIVFFLYIFML